MNKRITLVAGHYGSGKTNFAVNLAYKLKETVDKVAIVDLDIVNPYFRTKDSIDDFQKLGIKLIASKYAGTNVDLPALPEEVYSVTDDRSYTCILDIGGDDRGAYALGRYKDSIMEENQYEMIFVINKFRPNTRDTETTLEIMKEIEFASKIKFTAIVNNSNLGEETTKEDVLGSLAYANSISSATNLPILFTSVKEDLIEELQNSIDNLFPLRLQSKIN